MRRAYPGGLSQLAGPARELQQGAAQSVIDDLNLAPPHAMAEPYTERFDESFLGGKALGQESGLVIALMPLRELKLTQDARWKASTMTSQGRLEAGDLGQISTDTQNHGCSWSCSWSWASSAATKPASWPAIISRFIAATASLRPTNSARAIMAWPMLSSFKPGMA